MDCQVHLRVLQSSSNTCSYYSGYIWNSFGRALEVVYGTMVVSVGQCATVLLWLAWQLVLSSEIGTSMQSKIVLVTIGNRETMKVTLSTTVV